MLPSVKRILIHVCVKKKMVEDELANVCDPAASEYRQWSVQ